MAVTSGSVSTSVIDNGTYFYVNWQQASQSISGNYTTINYQYGVHCRYTYYSNAIRIDYVNINGTQVKGSETYSNLSSGDHQLGSGSMNIAHNSDGSKTFNINLSGWAYGAGTATGSQNFTLNTIPRKANITNAPDFNDEENPTITYSNQAGNSVTTLQACISLDNSTDTIEYRDIDKTGTSYTFELTTAERNLLRQATTDSNTLPVYFRIKTIIGGNTLYSSSQKTMSIINANPVFSNFEFEDVNSTTLALTGDSSKNVNGYSSIRATISTSNKATALKYATMSKYQFRVGSGTPLDITYSDSESVSGTIENAENGTYNVYAIDSRNNSTLVTKLSTQEIAYTPISFNPSSCKVERNNGGVGANAILTLSGDIWNNSFGQVTNSIKSAVVEYKETSSSTWLTSPTSITPTVTNNSFSFNGLVGSQEQDYTFELNKSYDFRVTITDELSTKIIQLTPMPSAIPNISFADDGVGIMCDYDENLGGDLQVGGEIVSGATNSYSTSSVKPYSANYSNNFRKKYDVIADSNAVETGRLVDGKVEYVLKLNLGTMPNNTNKRIYLPVRLTDIIITRSVEFWMSNSNSYSVYLGSGLYFLADDGSRTRFEVSATNDRSSYTGYVEIYFTYK